MPISEVDPQHPNYATILKERVVEQFFIRLDTVCTSVEELYIVSPVLGMLEGTKMTVERLRHLVRKNNIRMYLVTRSPGNEMVRGAPGHSPALEMLSALDGIEIRYNDFLHAKIYVCLCNDSQSSFAVIGSANMTTTSIKNNIEIGLMIRYAQQGRELINELGYWFNNNLRFQSKVAKKMAVKPMVKITK